MFGGGGTFELELCDLVNEVAQDVAQYRDWQGLVKTATITGDGTTTIFDRPADYGRMLIDTDIQDQNSWFWGFIHYDNINEFLFDEMRGFPGYPGAWIMVGDQIRFSTPPAAGQEAIYPYVSANIVRAATTVLKPEFTADDDTFLLPERLLTLGLVWRWRENKKLDASGDQEAFVKALDEYAAKDGGPFVLRRSSRVGFANVGIAWPWSLG